MSSAMSPLALFTIASAIWGSTWLAIKFQLGGVVPLEASVAYRFALAGVILAAWCARQRQSLRFAPRTLRQEVVQVQNQSA